MKTIFESVIARGGYNLTDLLARIDEYHIAGKLTDDDRDALYQQARAGADASHDADVMAKLNDLENRVAALEKGGTQPHPEPSAPPEYAPADRRPAVRDGERKGMTGWSKQKTQSARREA